MIRVALFLSFVLLGGVRADKEPSDSPKRLTPADCEKLVEQLVNPEKPLFQKDYVLDLPKGFEKHEKTFIKIEKAYTALSKNIEVALPVLMKYSMDDRYSYIEEQPGSGAYRNKTVGAACCRIVKAHVEAHLTKTFCHDGEGRPRAHFFIRSRLDEWWDTRKDKSLAELQLEAMEWVMKQPKPEFFESEKAWKEALQGVKTMADSIRKTKKPIVVEHSVVFIGK